MAEPTPQTGEDAAQAKPTSEGNPTPEASEAKAPAPHEEPGTASPAMNESLVSAGRRAASTPGRGPLAAELPDYTRSLLRVAVPVTVTLAEKRESFGQIVELGPGSIIQFDKSCEELLDLSAAGRKIAGGEAVKVGDKFGLRITSMVLPGERFEPVAGPGVRS